MALQITEIHNIFTGIVRPEGLSLVEMITIMAQKHANYFLNVQKETDEGTLADNYKNKMLQLITKVKQKDGTTLLSFRDEFVLNLANFETYANVKAYTDNDWQTKVESAIPTCFDIVANVTNAERTAYNGL